MGAIAYVHTLANLQINLGKQKIAHADRFCLLHTAHVKRHIALRGKHLLSCSLFSIVYHSSIFPFLFSIF